MPLFHGFKHNLKNNYSKKEFKKDLFAGIIVGLISLPIGMGLAVTTGVPPQHGLYCAFILGFIGALMGGSQTLILGPSAAFIAVVAPIVSRFGIEGLYICSFISGLILFLIGLTGLSRFVKFISPLVINGFTTGIAFVIFVFQIKDFLGLTLDEVPRSFFHRLVLITHAAPRLHIQDTTIGLLMIIFLYTLPTIIKKVPVPLIALSLTTAIDVGLKSFLVWPSLTIQNSFGVFPSSLPSFQSSWLTNLDQLTLASLTVSIVSLTLIALLETLVTTQAAENLKSTSFNPNSDVAALGLANMIAPFFQAIPGAGVISRTAANIKFGNESIFSSVIQSVFVFISMLALAPFVTLIPMSALAGLLIYVSFDLANFKGFKKLLKKSHLNDQIVLVTCTFVTIFFNMAAGVVTGVALNFLLAKFKKN